jgi:hypothetical protein
VVPRQYNVHSDFVALHCTRASSASRLSNVSPDCISDEVGQPTAANTKTGCYRKFRARMANWRLIFFLNVALKFNSKGLYASTINLVNKGNFTSSNIRCRSHSISNSWPKVCCYCNLLYNSDRSRDRRVHLEKISTAVSHRL